MSTILVAGGLFIISTFVYIYYTTWVYITVNINIIQPFYKMKNFPDRKYALIIPGVLLSIIALASIYILRPKKSTENKKTN